MKPSEMKKRTPIHRVISGVLRGAATPLTAEEIYHEIESKGLYAFNAQNPLHVVSSDLRRHCIDLNFPSARSMKYFKRSLSGDHVRYELLQKPEKVEPNVYKVRKVGGRGETIVTVASSDVDVSGESKSIDSVHTQIQFRLLELGSTLGFSTWAPIPDRGRRWNGRKISEIKGLVSKLPRQFEEATMKIISYIDVIWLQQSSIVAAFEVEHTTPVYSGLLRMADLMCMQPNLRIDWYLVAPETRFEKFANEVGRPTFCNLRTPLYQCCRFLSYQKLTERLDAAKEFIPHLKPAFLNDIAERYDPEDAFAE